MSIFLGLLLVFYDVATPVSFTTPLLRNLTIASIFSLHKGYCNEVLYLLPCVRV